MAATISSSLQFFLQLAKIQAVMTRRFDAGLGGLGLSEFLILLNLNQARDQKMRRIDLAAKIGLTASGVTRLLAPMEKIGLVKRETNSADARVSFVLLASGGKRRLADAMEYAELLAQEILPGDQTKALQDLSSLLQKFGSVL